ncbi:toprim domain-containing protein [Brevundimonas sp.]|uniref:DUF7146 domain-containing protein n=1 Tax=Brevundimonas sp. TaxID=1871086 RepID=UPI0035B41C0B
MTLQPLVAALGGDLYDGGRRANAPAPGHSASDRSVSLMLSGDRVVIHCFGGADWRTVRDHLEDKRLIDGAGRLIGAGPARPRAPRARPDRTARIAAARRLWDESVPIGRTSLSRRHLDGRAIRQDPETLQGLRHHPAVPIADYRGCDACRPALVAAITAPGGALTAVEVTYLAPNGRRDHGLRLSRKTVGVVPPGSAVRLARASSDLVVGEGVMTVLSAADRYGLPGWALLSANNLAAWRPPPETRRVVVAADRGAVGEAAAGRLVQRLAGFGVRGVLALPPAGAGDWNAVAAAERREEGG